MNEPGAQRAGHLAQAIGGSEAQRRLVPALQQEVPQHVRYEQLEQEQAKRICKSHLLGCIY